MSSIHLSLDMRCLIKSAAQGLTGPKRRAFIADVANRLCSGSSRLAETEFGFGRQAVALGQHEQRTGLVCYGNYEPSGRQKFEVSFPQLEEDICSLVDPESQADPQMRNTFAYTRITAKSVRQQLIEHKNWQDDQLPQERTISNILNRMGYKLRKVQKTKPEKKFQKPMPSSKTYSA